MYLKFSVKRIRPARRDGRRLAPRGVPRGPSRRLLGVSGGVYAADGRTGFVRRRPWTVATLAHGGSQCGAAFAGFLVEQDTVAIRLAVAADGSLRVRGGDDDAGPVTRFEQAVGVPHPDGDAIRVTGRTRLGFVESSGVALNIDGVGVDVAVGVGVDVAVLVGVGVAVYVDVEVCVGVDVAVAVDVSVAVEVAVAVAVRVAVAVDVELAAAAADA